MKPENKQNAAVFEIYQITNLPNYQISEAAEE
jgi:hypothetical protein